MRFGLKEATIKQINKVFFTYPQVKSVIIYGLRAKGNYRTGSDIDLTVIGEELTLQLIHKIELDLDDLFLPYTFDLSVFQDIDNPDLVDYIQRVVRIIQENRPPLEYPTIYHLIHWYYQIFDYT